jgi:hypothetical protein
VAKRAIRPAAFDAGAPIGSLYQFFPVKEALADTLEQNYVALLVADPQALETRANQIDTETLVEGLFGLADGVRSLRRPRPGSPRCEDPWPSLPPKW